MVQIRSVLKRTILNNLIQKIQKRRHIRVLVKLHLIEKIKKRTPTGMRPPPRRLAPI